MAGESGGSIISTEHLHLTELLFFKSVKAESFIGIERFKVGK
jgi:hypothetical protein